MTDSTAEQMPATVREWTDILARIRFGTTRIGGKNVAGSRVKSVAGRLATYADGNGTRIRPGLARLALDLEIDHRAVGAIVAYLRRIGLLGLVRAGNGTKADEYRLTLPVDLLERDDLEVWSPARQAAELERVRAIVRGRKRPSGDGPGGPDGGRTHAPEGQAIDTDTHAPEGHADGENACPSGTGDACPSGVQKSADACPSGGATHVPQGRATHQDLDTTTTHHPDQDLRTAVTPSRANGPANNPESSSAKSKRCPHGLKPTRRPDGRPTCALCRVAEDRPATQHPPPPSARLAPVIQLPTREVS